MALYTHIISKLALWAQCLRFIHVGYLKLSFIHLHSCIVFHCYQYVISVNSIDDWTPRLVQGQFHCVSWSIHAASRNQTGKLTSIVP